MGEKLQSLEKCESGGLEIFGVAEKIGNRGGGPQIFPDFPPRIFLNGLARMTSYGNIELGQHWLR